MDILLTEESIYLELKVIIDVFVTTKMVLIPWENEKDYFELLALLFQLTSSYSEEEERTK